MNEYYFWIGLVVMLFSSYVMLRNYVYINIVDIIMSGLAGFAFGIAWPILVFGLIIGLPVYGLVKIVEKIQNESDL